MRAAEGVTAVRAADGTVAARKAVAPDDVARLVHEVAVLRRLDGLAVAQPLDGVATGARGWVDLRYVGAHTLETAGPDLREEQLLQALGSAAATLTAAHARGVSHGRLDASHVLLAPDGTAVLCGWRGAGLRPNEPDPAVQVRAGAEPGAAASDGGLPGATFSPEADVAALGTLAVELARANPATSARVRTQLGAIATAATHPDPTVRPPMAELARVLRGAAAPTPTGRGRLRDRVGPIRRWLARGARLTGAGPAAGALAVGPTADDGLAAAARVRRLSSLDLAAGAMRPGAPTPEAVDRRLRGPAGRAVAAGFAAATAATLTVVLWPSGGRDAGSVAATGSSRVLEASAAASSPATGPGDAGAMSAAGATGDAVGASDAGGLPRTGAPDAGPPSGAATADVACPDTATELTSSGLPASCAPSVRVDGEHLRLGTVSFAVGAAGDVAGLSDLACDGLLEPTVLQPATGRVYVFDGWTDGVTAPAARLVGEVAGSTKLGDPTGSACGVVRVTLADGSEVALSGEHG